MLLCATLLPYTSSAQVGKPAWTNVPFKGKKKPLNYWGPQCANGNSFVLTDMNQYVAELVGYTIPEEGKAISVPVTMQGPTGASTIFSNFHVVGGRPCIVITVWDDAAQTLTAKVQPFTTEWVADGDPVTLGTIPVDPKSYHGGRANITVTTSRDDEKVLFLFDDIQSNGIKLALCWVLDNELNPIWQGGYRIPVQAKGSRRTAVILDNGHVYIAMMAVTLDEENTKEDKDGNVKVKASTANDKPDATLYELYGETFNSWDTRVPELNGSLFAMPVLVRDRVLVAGALKNNDPKDMTVRWAVLEMNEGLTPTVVTNGQMGEIEKGQAAGTMVLDKQGTPYLCIAHSGQAHVLAFDRDLNLKWTKQAPWGRLDVLPAEEGLYMPTLLNDGLWKGVQAGKPYPRVVNYAGNFWPALLRWNADGSHSYHRLLPEDVKQERNKVTGRLWFDFSTLGSCGQYIDFSYEKDHPGMVRVKVD